MTKLDELKNNLSASEQEFRHALSLLADLGTTVQWDGRYVTLPIDPECRFNDGSGACGKPLSDAVIFRTEVVAHAIALCPRHAKLMSKAVEEWRKKA